MEMKELKPTKKTKWQCSEFLKQESTKRQLWLGGGLLAMIISIIIILNLTNRINSDWTIIVAIIVSSCVLWGLILSLQFANYFRGKNPPKEHTFFETGYTDEEKHKLFNGLVNGGFIHKETKIENFLFVFGGTETFDFKKIQWISTSALLAYLIDNCFEGNALWEKTKNGFIVHEKEPNKNYLKNVVSKYKSGEIEKPKGFNEIDKILNNL